MFGLSEAMLSFLRRQIGLRTDSADAAGSLHAKTGDIKNSLTTLESNLHKNVTVTSASCDLVEDGQTVELLSIAGERVVLGGNFVFHHNTDVAFQVELEIDSVVVWSLNNTEAPNTSSPYYSAKSKGAELIYDGNGGGSIVYKLPIVGPFKINSSLILRYKNTGTTYSVNGACGAIVYHRAV